MKNSEQHLDHESSSKKAQQINSKKEWEEPQLIILDSKQTLGGPNGPTTPENASYHT